MVIKLKKKYSLTLILCETGIFHVLEHFLVKGDQIQNNATISIL